MILRQTVLIWGKPYEVTVMQKTKTVWIAEGVYMGEILRVKGSSPDAAVAHWRVAAAGKGLG